MLLNTKQDTDTGARVLGLTLCLATLTFLELALQMGVGFAELAAAWGLVPALVLGVLIIPLLPPHAASTLPLLAAGVALGCTFESWSLPPWLAVCLGAAFAGPGLLWTLRRLHAAARE